MYATLKIFFIKNLFNNMKKTLTNTITDFNYKILTYTYTYICKYIFSYICIHTQSCTKNVPFNILLRIERAWKERKIILQWKNKWKT